MSPPLQAKLLRVTQGGRFQRIGSNREVNTNARILAREQPRPRRRGQGRPVSRRFVLPSERGGFEHPAVA